MAGKDEGNDHSRHLRNFQAALDGKARLGQMSQESTYHTRHRELLCLHFHSGATLARGDGQLLGRQRKRTTRCLTPRHQNVQPGRSS